MRKESLIIRNFGPIKEVVLDDIRPLTVIIGPSGIGKSTILKVVSLFRWILKMLSIRAYLKRSGMRKQPFRLMISSYIKNNGWTGFVSKDTVIEYHFGAIEIVYRNGKLNNPKITNGENLHLEKVSFISDSRIIIPDILALKAKTEDFYTNETLEDFTLAMDQLTEVPIPYLGVKGVTRKQGSKKEYIVQSTDDENAYDIRLDNSSSGTQTAMSIETIVRYYTSDKYDLVKSLNRAILGYLASYDKFTELKFAQNIGDIPSRRVSLMIEEPELSLSPEMQIALLNNLVRRCFIPGPEDYEMGVFITTHSPYIVNQLNLLILAGDRGITVENASLKYEDIQVYRLTKKEGLASLKSRNRQFIDPLPLSDSISDIYDQYRSIVSETTEESDD